jgi:hypothetical protein
LKLSAIDGTAFVDFSSAGVLTNYIDAKLTITDTAGKKVVGYIKAAGTGQTYSAELVTDGAMAVDDLPSWTRYTADTVADSVSGGVVGNCAEIYRSGGSAGVSGIYQSITSLIGACYIGTGNVKAGLSGSYASWGSYAPGSDYMAAYTDAYSWLGYSNNFTATTINIFIYLFSMSTEVTKKAYHDELSCKRILTPSATGVTIVSEHEGGTYNWTSQESGFNYNDASGYTYIIEWYGAVSLSASPSLSPSASKSPSASPSASPSKSPSASPSISPSASPSRSPSESPSETPSASPSPARVEAKATDCASGNKIYQTVTGLTIGSRYRVEGAIEDFLNGSAMCYANPGGIDTYGTAGTADGVIYLDFNATATSHVIGVASGTDGSNFRVGYIHLHALYEETITLGTDTEAVALDITTYSDPRLWIVITKSGSTALCGEIVVGNSYDLGTLLYAPTIGIIDYSVKSVDAFGNYSVTERAYSTRASFDLIVENTEIDALFTKIADIRATPVVYVGSETHLSLVVYGYYKEFSLIIPYKDYSTYSLDVEGLT